MKNLRIWYKAISLKNISYKNQRKKWWTRQKKVKARLMQTVSPCLRYQNSKIYFIKSNKYKILQRNTYTMWTAGKVGKQR